MHLAALKHLLDPKLLLEQFGYIGLFLVVFAESGLFFGFFLPGDSLLIIAGVLAATGYLNLLVLIPVVFVGAFLGDQIGYWTGAQFGRRLFTREKGWFLNKHHINEAETFFTRHGSKTIILSRFVPIIRTFAPIVAGIARMPYKTFVTFNLIGSILWAIGILVLGYFVGNIPGVDHYLNLVIAVIIVLSLVPVALHALKPKPTK